MADNVIVVDAGLAIVTNRMIGQGTEPKYVHWGSGTTTPVPGNTALETPRNEARVEGTSSRQQTNAANDTYQVIGTLTCADTAAAITEAGLFDAAGSGTPPSGGNLFLRGTFSEINLNPGDSVQFTIQAVFDQAA